VLDSSPPKGRGAWSDASRQSGIEGDRATLLVVDDEPVNRAVLRGYLGARHRIIEAASGIEALAILEHETPDLILLDVMMPQLSGIETCKRIKAQPRGQYLPIVLVTALGEQRDRIAGLEAGADDFLTKPVDRHELQLRVNAFLRLRRQDGQIRSQLDELTHLQSAKDDLVSLILHDVRSPLAGQMALLTLVSDDLRARGDTLLADDLDLAMRSTRKVNEALEEVLRVRLLEEGQLPLERTLVQLGTLVEDAVRTFSGVARVQGTPLAVTVAGDRPVSIDGKLARRAIENLLANALRYSPQGAEVSISVRASSEVLEVEIDDQGPGVPDNLKETLFAKFGSVEAAAGGVRRGIGLGLYLVRLVAEGHGGAVAVEDRPGGGSRFRFWLQLA
jgi:two-component system sensor histidine kinase/response regulator